MAYNVTKLITRAYSLSSVISHEFEQISGSQLKDGLDLLNDILAETSINTRLIPYFKEYELQLIPGQADYFIPGLTEVETATFNIGDVRFSMEEKTRVEFYGLPRVDNVNALPGTYHLERSLNGAMFSVYFNPVSDYLVKIWGKFSLEEVAFNDDLTDVFDRYYINYLRYALAEYICQENNLIFTQDNRAELNSIISTLTYVSPIDFTIQKLSTLNKRQVGMNWAYVNLGYGYTR